MIQHSHAYVPSVGASCFYCKNPTWKVTSQEVGTAIARSANPTRSLSFCTLFIVYAGEQMQSGLDWGGGRLRGRVISPPATLLPVLQAPQS